jgi:ribonuclease Z
MSSLEIVFLGTSASVPTAERSLPSTLIKYQGLRYLVDCGEGTQLRLMQAGESLKIRRIFLTHDHLDHILGLAGLLFSISIRRMRPIPRVTVYGGDTTLQRAKTLIQMIRSKPTSKPHVEVEFVEVTPGMVFSEKNITVQAFRTNHRERPCYGYIFKTKGLRSEKAVFTGDTGYFDRLIGLAANADYLISEANFLSDQEELAKKVGHLTARQAASIARSAKVETLLLTHVSRKYDKAMDRVLDEARRIFPRTFLPKDLERYSVT